ncbi:surface carbohydrate biosynthesis protein [Oceanobacillus saliphilus]|uniref:surface carbohydrate biosynthesis protein n=1 Tax=Oceanobacillus saliphilus TaxID=2925834 RepID=UPI00201D665E|nr:surface carbohydrate biosynthesis protein [Oceanobacillus saliphilus]
MKPKAKLVDMMEIKMKKRNNMERKKSKNKWLFLPIETKVREIDAKLLLAYYAAQENYNVVLGLSELVEEALEFLPKGIFLDKGYSSKDKLRRFKIAKDNGHISVNLEEEGFPLTEKDLYLAKHVDQKSLSILNYEFCWGEVQKNTLTNAYPFVEKKCYITGNPRFDLLKKKYRVLFDDKVAKIKDQYGSFILVNTKFPLYTKAVDDNGTINEKIFNRLGNVYGENMTNNMLTEYKNFIIMIKEISKRYPKTNIVVRPHPSEKFSVYTQDLMGCKNVFVVQEGNVINWILASKLIIHSGCTTGVESFLLEKPVVSYITTKYAKYDLPNELSIKVYNIRNLFNIIDHDMENYKFGDDKFDEEKKITLLSKHYANGDVNYSYKIILNILNGIIINNDYPSDNIVLNKELLSKLKKELNKKVYRENTIVKQKFPDLTGEEIESFFNKLNKIEKKENKIVVRKLHDKFFEITAKQEG